MASSYASSSTSAAAFIDPWEKMRQAKMDLMADEEEQFHQRRERRRSRREDSLGGRSECSLSSLASDNLRTTKHRSSPTPRSILRRSTASSFGSLGRESFDSLDSFAAVPQASSSRSSYSYGGYTSEAFQQSTPTDTTRVRFSGDSLASSGLGIAFLSPASFAGSSVGSEYSPRMLCPPSEADDIELDEFVPQSLAYPRIARRVSQSAVAFSRDNLRHLVSRTSLLSQTMPDNRAPSYAPSSTPSMRDSLGSIASTMYSNLSSSISESKLPSGSAYSTLLPSHGSVRGAVRVPTINRATWHESVGLSPRSGPSPIAEQEEVMCDALPVATEAAAAARGAQHEPSESTEIFGFPLPPSREMSAADSICVDSHDGEFCLDTPRPGFDCSVFSQQLEFGSPLSDSKASLPNESYNSSTLLDYAVENGIISRNSHLLGRRRSHSISSDHKPEGESCGWSGSESEEEDFTQAIRQIGLRRLDRKTRSRASPDAYESPALPPLSLVMHAGPRPSRPVDRLSQQSCGSGISTMSSAGPLTPSISGDACTVKHERRVSASSSGSSAIGNYPWGRSSSSPSGSVCSDRSDSGDRPFDAAFGRSTSTKRMPTPTRRVEGWGRPELLTSAGWSDSEDEESRGMMRVKKYLEKVQRSGSPDFDENGPGWGDLSHETLDEMPAA